MSGSLRFVSNFHRLSFGVLRSKQLAVVNNVSRHIRTTSKMQLREIVEKTEGKITTVEGRILNSPREHKIADLNGPEDACSLCRLNMELKYTDIKIISQFVQEDGEIVPRQITGLCYYQHANMKNLIHKAHSAGLMQTLRPPIYPEEYSQMSDHAWKKYNVYYMEGTDQGKAT